MTAKFYIVHLERAKARRANVDRLIEELPGDVSIIDAVDARTLSESDTAKYYHRSIHFPRYPFELRPSEIACFLSHRRAWKQIADGDDRAAMVLEDDCLLEAEDFSRALDLVQANTAEEDFVRFPHMLREVARVTIAERDGTVLFHPRHCALRMLMQYVGKEAARGLLNATETFDRPVDTFLQMTWITKCRPSVVWPSGVREISQDLGGSTIGAPMSALQKLYRETARPLYRAVIHCIGSFKSK